MPNAHPCGDPHDCYCHEGEDVSKVIADLRAQIARNARFVAAVREIGASFDREASGRAVCNLLDRAHREIYGFPCEPERLRMRG